MQMIESNIVRINDANILQLSRNFQNSLGTSPLTYKSHICHILSTSGILLVKDHQHPDLAKFIDSNTTHIMLKDIHEQIGIHSQQFSIDILIKLMEIVQQCVAKQITIQRLLALIDEESNAYQDKAILCFKILIEQLPNDSFDAKEFELTIRLIQPILLLLFEDREENIYLRRTDAQTEEDKSNCSNKRPDGCITLKTYEKIDVGFIEVKEEKY
ncbi:uncharacterized protein BX663DRAFT_563455 [Cokeromyces recurvatus]|uniref:uncharacterized protein n=1 Tax=Cokeromyces recurvatus TaxID=90255 RepID=UPI002220C4B1|nr:uncharacterized protein BX663DRAFT_563455 [Cokeromyces recurvatus]KAI7899997.1 hypothetical protein BX663DRAFT_563455 [Cokeromyces recurvatus]